MMAPSLVVIVGPTASGKTALAIRLAQEFRGEIVSADSRAIYKYMDVGTAKPSVDERGGVAHWGIDLVEPGARFTAADFKLYADEKIAEIRSRGHIPFLVGGTGLYINSVVYNYQFPAAGNNVELREELMRLPLDQLYKYCAENNVLLPENSQNKRYVVNNILRNRQVPERSAHPAPGVIIVGLSTDKATLRKRIQLRARSIAKGGVIEEATRVADRYGWESEAMTAIIYRHVRDYKNGAITLPDLESRLAEGDWRLAKRQMTWFKRDEHIKWLDIESAYTYIARLLADSFDS